MDNKEPSSQATSSAWGNKEPTKPPNQPSEPQDVSSEALQQKTLQGDQQGISGRGNKKQQRRQKQAIVTDDQPTLGNRPSSQPTASAWGNKDPSSQPTSSPWGNKENLSQPQSTALQSPKMQSHSEDMKTTQLPRDVKNPPVIDSIKNLTLSDSVPSSSTSLSSSATAVSDIHTSALIKITPNKGSGTRGRKVLVDVNFLPLYFDKLLSTVYQYDVTIEPNLPKRLLPKIFEEYRKTNFKDCFIAFDGQKIAVSPKMLRLDQKIERQTNVLDENGKERTYMVTMKEANNSKIDFSSLKK